MRVQLRLESRLTFEEYVTSRAWEKATLEACPLCAPETCHFQRLGTYMRKIPAVGFVTRYYCPERHTTFGLLPDCYASRTPGTLDEIECTAAKAEVSTSVERTAEEVRPADAPDAVTLSAAVGWVRRRVAWMRALLVTVAGLFPDAFADAGRSVQAFREHLATSRVLVALRGICAQHLHALPRPLGLNPGMAEVMALWRKRQQSTGAEVPPDDL
jgi:hypothetical protein